MHIKWNVSTMYFELCRQYTYNNTRYTICNHHSGNKQGIKFYVCSELLTSLNIRPIYSLYEYRDTAVMIIGSTSISDIYNLR